jgi:hypothetical protein
MPASNMISGPSTKMVAELQAELIAMEKQEAAEAQRKKDCKQQQKSIAEAQHKAKAEVQKAEREAKRVEKWKVVESTNEADGSSPRKRAQGDDEELEEARVSC